MLFTEPRFALFFAFCFVVRWALPTYGAQKYFLLLCNIVFYAGWDGRFLLLMAGYIFFNHALAQRIAATPAQERKKRWIWLCVLGNLSVLGFFKYYNFFANEGASFFNWLGIGVEPITLEIVLPVGISFITFQAMSYVIDVYRGELQPVDIFDFALFKSFFPQLVAGPIVRASHFLPQLQVAPKLADVRFRPLLTLFFIGYFKKACVADNIAHVIDPVFAKPLAHGASDVLFAAFGYSFQIYCDFSGYTDMAIAIAGLLGFSLVKNFDAPYLSTSIQDFWRRWHISLSSWLRDYLYVPLGGSRGSRLMLHRNLILTMVLGGLWHGANMTFVLWGLLHGLALSAQRLWNDSRLRGLPPFGVPLVGWALTFLWVVLCFTLFRCDSVTTFGVLLSRLGAQSAASTLDLRLWWLLALLGGMHVVAYHYRAPLVRGLHALPAPAYAVMLGVATGLALFFTPVATAPFIYFQF